MREGRLSVDLGDKKKVDSISVMIRDGCDEEMKYTYTYEVREREVS